jgi:predicted heme/steroid binding protein
VALTQNRTSLRSPGIDFSVKYRPVSEQTTFTLQELKRFDGENGLMYIAYKGIVYDVSMSRRWQSGLHEGLHFPAQDLSEEMFDSPHGEEVFLHPGIRKVGYLRH